MTNGKSRSWAYMWHTEHTSIRCDCSKRPLQKRKQRNLVRDARWLQSRKGAVSSLQFSYISFLKSLLTNFSWVSITTYFGRGLRFVGSTVDDKNACRKGSMFCPFCKSNFITWTIVHKIKPLERGYNLKKLHAPLSFLSRGLGAVFDMRVACTTGVDGGAHWSL